MNVLCLAPARLCDPSTWVYSFPDQMLWAMRLHISCPRALSFLTGRPCQSCAREIIPSVTYPALPQRHLPPQPYRHNCRCLQAAVQRWNQTHPDLSLAVVALELDFSPHAGALLSAPAPGSGTGRQGLQRLKPRRLKER